MTTPCDLVAERVALGEPLDEHAEHAASCERCQRLVALPAQLGATKHAIDPGMGFSARMTAGAQQRIVARKRRQIAAGAVTALAACGVFALIVTHGPDRPDVAVTEPGAQSHDDIRRPEIDPDVASLVHFARTDRARSTAPWGKLEKPLRPYRKLIKGLTP